MARNEEKANAALNRWVSMKTRERLDFHEKRPFRPTMVTTIAEAENWRADVIREIREKTHQIQNGFLGEQRIRDMNDTINALLQEKRRWERRITELGGANHARSTLVYDSKGNVIGGGGSLREYKYFGAARDLPGVREMLAEREKSIVEREQQRQRRKGPPESSKKEESEQVLEYPCCLAVAANPLVYSKYIPEITSDFKCLFINSIFFMNKYQLCFSASKVLSFQEPAALSLKILPPLKEINDQGKIIRRNRFTS